MTAPVHPLPRPGAACSGLAALLLFWASTASAHAAPLLRCQIEQGYMSAVHDFPASNEPYAATPLEVRGRFRFKAVVFAEGAAVEYVKLYTSYYLRGQPVLIQMAQYDHPKVSASATADSLTGLQRVYSPRLGHKMRYQCRLLEAAP